LARLLFLVTAVLCGLAPLVAVWVVLHVRRIARALSDIVEELSQVARAVNASRAPRQGDAPQAKTAPPSDGEHPEDFDRRLTALQEALETRHDGLLSRLDALPGEVEDAVDREVRALARELRSSHPTAAPSTEAPAPQPSGMAGPEAPPGPRLVPVSRDGLPIPPWHLDRANRREASAPSVVLRNLDDGMRAARRHLEQTGGSEAARVLLEEMETLRAVEEQLADMPAPANRIQFARSHWQEWRAAVFAPLEGLDPARPPRDHEDPAKPLPDRLRSLLNAERAGLRERLRKELGVQEIAPRVGVDRLNERTCTVVFSHPTAKPADEQKICGVRSRGLRIGSARGGAVLLKAEVGVWRFERPTRPGPGGSEADKAGRRGPSPGSAQRQSREPGV